MKKKTVKVLIISALILLAGIFVLWCIGSQVISREAANQVDALLTRNYDTHGAYTEDLRDVISPELYDRLNYRDQHILAYQSVYGFSPDDSTKEEHRRTYPTVHFFFTKCYVYYNYTYIVRSKINGESLVGSIDAEVKLTLSLKNGKWVISGKEEAP